jgi:uncharacterized protein (TIGR02265 family)
MPLGDTKPGPEIPKHLEFQNTIEGVFLRSIGLDLTPELKTQLRAQGLDLDKPLLPAYPAEDFHRWVRTASVFLYPNNTEAEGLRFFGRRGLAGLSQTLLGKALKATFSILGPRRSLYRTSRAFRTNNNYTAVTVADRAPGSVELAFNEVYGLPTYYQGVAEGAGSLMNAKNYRVSIVDTSGRGARYLVQWDE